VSSKWRENTAQLRPVASSLGMVDGRLSLGEAVVMDMVVACKRVDK